MLQPSCTHTAVSQLPTAMLQPPTAVSQPSCTHTAVSQLPTAILQLQPPTSVLQPPTAVLQPSYTHSAVSQLPAAILQPSTAVLQPYSPYGVSLHPYATFTDYHCTSFALTGRGTFQSPSSSTSAHGHGTQVVSAQFMSGWAGYFLSSHTATVLKW